MKWSSTYHIEPNFYSQNLIGRTLEHMFQVAKVVAQVLDNVFGVGILTVVLLVTWYPGTYYLGSYCCRFSESVGFT